MAQFRTRDDQYMLRLPDGMRDQIKAAAAANGRSMNAEIIHRLQTWREPSAGSNASVRLEVDTTQADQALRLVNQLRDAAPAASSGTSFPRP